jgi:hypothetical protein
MQSSDLVSKFSKMRFIGKQKKFTSAEDVYNAASIAQAEILRDLKVLQDKTNIVFPAATETCVRQSRTVSTITGITTVEVTTTEAHGYQTGEEYIIQGVLGITGVNGRRTITVTSTTKFTLNGATGSGSYTSGGTIYPLINSITDLISSRQVSPNTFLMTKVDYDEVNNDREEFGTSSPTDSVFRVYQLETDPPTIGVQGTPSANVTLESRFYRIPLPNEDISDTVNPIVPDKYRRAMELGTLCYIYEDMDDNEAVDLAEKQRILFDREKMRIIGSVAKSRLRSNAIPKRMNW